MWYQSRPQTIRITQAPQQDRGRQGADGDKGVARIGWERMSGLNGTEVDKSFPQSTSDKNGVDPRDKCGLSCSSWYMPETSKMLIIWAYASLPDRGRLTWGPWPRGPRCRTGLELPSRDMLHRLIRHTICPADEDENEKLSGRFLMWVSTGNDFVYP
ncbi:hypothetical protein GH714_024389 [Hevea brasiliensis]|uniref:Uncharacterized protein n=1 Tax=Hevea brasiliensis TaxID=3981 RepID=A0A6A6L949_HEVBR|nr:hypothetical protein GH714_024389 [Hevea brasiliensis]